MIFKDYPIFKGLSNEEFQDILRCPCVVNKAFKKGEVLLHQSQVIESIYIVLKGRVNEEMVDFWGKKTILFTRHTGELIGETYALTGDPLIADYVATEDVRALSIDIHLILQGNHKECSWHNKLIQNLLFISAQDNLQLSHHIFQTSFTKIRPRVISYLSRIALKKDSNDFQISFNRQELADYLHVDRSALSKELMKMKEEGLIDYRRNHFVLHKKIRNKFY